VIGSPTLMGRSIGDATSSRAGWLALGLATIATAAATWWILLGDAGVAAGVAVAIAGVGLLAGGAMAKRSPAVAWLRRWWFVDSTLDRLFDGALLGSIAWTARQVDPTVCAGALVALGTGFLGSYVRARGAALGYGVEESPATRALRYGILAVGLITSGLDWAVWTVAGVSVLATIVRSSQVAKEERA
jgi:hypothetical protein